MMHLLSIASSFPDRKVTQHECLALLGQSGHLEALKPRSRVILEKVLLGDSGISTRRLAPEKLEEILAADPEELHRLFEREAPRLAATALEDACAKAALLPGQIDALLICTCTGYLCPGVTSHVSERLGLRTDALLLDLLGQGCGAALPMLEAARGIIAGNPDAGPDLSNAPPAALRVVHPPGSVDVRGIRAKLDLTQADFAARFGFSVGAVRDWEQGRKKPDTPTRVLLMLIDRDPELVADAVRAVAA